MGSNRKDEKTKENNEMTTSLHIHSEIVVVCKMS